MRATRSATMWGAPFTRAKRSISPSTQGLARAAGEHSTTRLFDASRCCTSAWWDSAPVKSSSSRRTSSGRSGRDSPLGGVYDSSARCSRFANALSWGEQLMKTSCAIGSDSMSRALVRHEGTASDTGRHSFERYRSRRAKAAQRSSVRHPPVPIGKRRGA
jgi:hypothetical protein